MKYIFLSLLLFNFSALLAEGLKAEKIYKVNEKDTLWKIAQNEYGDGNMWFKIYIKNRDIIKNPDLIYSYMTLILPEIYERINPEYKEFSLSISSEAKLADQVKINSGDEIKDEKSKEYILPESILKDTSPSHLTSKPVLFDRDEFYGFISDVNSKDNFEKEGLIYSGDEIVFKTDKKVFLSDRIAVYSKISKRGGKIEVELNGICDVSSIVNDRVICKVSEIRGPIEKGDLVKKL